MCGLAVTERAFMNLFAHEKRIDSCNENDQLNDISRSIKTSHNYFTSSISTLLVPSDYLYYYLVVCLKHPVGVVCYP